MLATHRNQSDVDVKVLRIRLNCQAASVWWWDWCYSYSYKCMVHSKPQCVCIFLRYHQYPPPYARQLVVSHSDPEFKTLPGSATCKGLMTQYMPELVCAMKPQRWWSLDDASLTSLILSTLMRRWAPQKLCVTRAFDDPWPRRPYHTRETGPYWRSYRSIEPTVSPQKLCVTDS